MYSHLITHRELECDVLVVGGGPSGVPAAIAAARAGAKVILCHDRPVLGGNASSEVRMHIVGANMGRQDKTWELESRESGIIEEIRLASMVLNPQRSAPMLDLIFLEKCRAEENLTLYLNTSVHEVKVENGRIVEALARRHSTEDTFSIRADVVIDCTGDGSIGAAAGAPVMRGREAKDEFNEPQAQDQRDGKTLGSTLLFMARRHDRPMPFKAPVWARKFKKEDFRLRNFYNAAKPSYEYGYWWLEWGGQLDTIKDNEEIRDELQAILFGVWDMIKNGGNYEADCWALEWFGFLPGKRESRRFKGQHVLSEGDLYASKEFSDAIAYGGWPIDTHPPEGIDAPDEPPCIQNDLPYLYDIPLSCCVNHEIENLMFAGRNISATHIAFASTRVMATCALMGEGVGVSAAYAVANKVAPNRLPSLPEAMHAIQQRLLREDVYLIGRTDEGANDLARCATITASSEQPEGAAINVISGQSRSVRNAVPEGRENDTGSHRWMSDPAAGLPAWLELRWSEPVAIDRVDLTFDSALQRHMTHTHSDGYFNSMHSGTPPELVKDFVLEVETASGWQPFAELKDHWERRYRSSDLALKGVKALRIRVTATHGLDHARVVSVGVY